MFLFPLLILFEVGLVIWLRQGDAAMTNKAHGALVNLFRIAGVRAEDLGLPILSLPAVGLVMTLLAWQVIGRFPWRFRWSTVGCMAAESVAMAAPLLPLGLLASRFDAGLWAASGDASMRSLDALSRLTMAAGAGIYEELVFRMAVMGALHMLLADVGGWKGAGSWVVSATVAAVLFAAYHPLLDPSGSFHGWRFAFLTVGGLWFGVLYHWRGFGVVAGAHAAYDITALLLWRG
ncbi:MAG: CPBP family intramembrane metalloprotease [Planctomycetes bacterium]|nr:CPBP family intramembrane metalloprotease [Planctomycetota bacterium]